MRTDPESGPPGNDKLVLAVFDPSVTYDSPVGSCLLAMLQPLVGTWRIHLISDRTDVADAPLVHKTKIRLPKRPVFLRAILYTLLSTCVYVVSRRDRSSLRISSEGGLPFCHISYNQFCHRLFLSRHREHLGGGGLRQRARLLTHGWGALMEKIALRNARVVVVPSSGLARELESVYPTLTRGKVRIIPNPVDTHRFERPANFESADVRTRLHIAQDAFVLSFCALGNYERKGLGIVLEALAQVSNLGIHLIVIGGTAGENREFAGIAKNLGVEGAVHFAGFQKDVRPYLWASNAYVFPSIYETFCLACFQAAAAGLPLIVTPFSGVEEFVVPGENGWVVERSANSVQAAIRDAARSPQKTAQMGEAAKQRVELYRQELFQARWLALLEKECGVPVEAPAN